MYFGVQLESAADVPQVERDWNAAGSHHRLPGVPPRPAQEADQMIRPEALALGAFGCIAGLTTLG